LVFWRCLLLALLLLAFLLSLLLVCRCCLPDDQQLRQLRLLSTVMNALVGVLALLVAGVAVAGVVAVFVVGVLAVFVAGVWVSPTRWMPRPGRFFPTRRASGKQPT
jgi:hypothetical protein